MAAPRRLVSSALLRARGPSALRAPASFVARAVSTYNARPPTPRSQLSAARAVPTPNVSVRSYSTDPDNTVPGSRPWTFEQINEQLKVNEELEQSGKQQTPDGKHKVIFVGALLPPFPPPRIFALHVRLTNRFFTYRCPRATRACQHWQDPRRYQHSCHNPSPSVPHL